jgi:toxin CcdB
MARFDVYASPDGAGYLLDVQADVLSGLTTRVVIPLMPSDRAPVPATRLNPVFDVDGASCVLVTQFLAAVPGTILRKPVATLTDQSAEISNAVDMLLVGF